MFPGTGQNRAETGSRGAADGPDPSDAGHSVVAVTDAFMLLIQSESTTTPKEQLRAEAQQEARRALALDPHNGKAYLA